MNKSLLITWMIIGAILLAACAAAESETGLGEWKTFTNEKYGYTFEVPASCYEGPLRGECKQSPPEERSEDCLCFIDGSNPESVFFQNITISDEGTPMATFSVMSPDTPAYSPGEGADLVTFVKQEFGELYSTEIPSEPNMELDGIPALRIPIDGSPGVAAYQDILFLRNGKLFKINMSDIEIETNMKIYNKILESFNFSE